MVSERQNNTAPYFADAAVRAAIGEMVAGHVTLLDFRQWFAPIAWRLGGCSQSENPLARKVELLLAERRSSADLMDSLALAAHFS